jgi:hypothetical protein
MVADIDEKTAKRLAACFESPEFVNDERDYKQAVHLIISQLISDNYINSRTFPSLLARFMTGDLEPAEIGLSPEQATTVEEGLRNVNAPVYQVFTYSVALDASGVLVYPRVNRDVDVRFGCDGITVRLGAIGLLQPIDGRRGARGSLGRWLDVAACHF